MNIEHSAVMRRFSAQGGLLNWDTSSPSVWLTAWALRTFSIIWFQDWEDYIYVDPKVCSKLFTKITNFCKQKVLKIREITLRKKNICLKRLKSMFFEEKFERSSPEGSIEVMTDEFQKALILAVDSKALRYNHTTDTTTV